MEITKVLGTVAMVPKGEYDAEEYYEYLNVVTYNGSSYMARKSSHGVLPTNDEYWQLVAQKAARTYQSVADMKSDDDLKEGMVTETLGYYEPNDGGAAVYQIVDDDTLISDNGTIHTLTNGMKAVLNIGNEGVSPSQFGAYTNNSNESITTQAFQNCINYCEDNNIQIIDNGKSIYKINDTLEITKKLSINLNNSIIRATTTNSIFEINEELTNDEQYTGNSHHGKIEKIILDCNNIALKGLNVLLAPRRIFENIRVTNVPGAENNIGYAFYLDGEKAGAQVKFINCYADNKTPNNYATVFYNAKSDVILDGLDYVGFSRGIEHIGGNAYYNNCHGFITAPYEISYPNSFFAKINSSSRIVFNNPYPDTQKYGFYITGPAPRLKINGLCNFHNINIATKECIETYGQATLFYIEGDTTDAYMSILNSVFTSPTFSDDSRSVVLTNKTKQNFYIDNSTSMPVGNDLFNENLASSKGEIVQLTTSTGTRYFRLDRTDHGLIKNKLYKIGDNVVTDIQLLYNPSLQGKIPRLVNNSTKFARTEQYNFGSNINQKFFVPYGHQTDNGVVNDGYLIFEILPTELSGDSISQSRFALYSNGVDFSTSREICDTNKNQDYVIDINVSYLVSMTKQ